MILATISESDLNFLLMLSVVLVAVKIALLAFLSIKEISHVKEAGKFSFGFVFGVIILMVCLILSRLIYMYFDFALTFFESSTYYTFPAVWYWKVATAIASTGYAIFIFVTDYRVFKFKFKGVISYILLVFTVLVILYPVNSKADFDILSTFLLSANLLAITIPVFFFYIGRQKSPYQVPSLLIAFGVIIYAIGDNIQTESILAAFEGLFGGSTRLAVAFITLLCKIAGLSMFALGVSSFATKFSK
jgi:hypothetical protein